MTQRVNGEQYALWRVESAQITDVAFIIDSWCADESVRVSRQSGEDPEVFKVGMRKRILRLLSSCRCVVIRPTPEWFAAQGLPVDPKKLLGWCCYSLDRSTLRPIIHFVYVQNLHRKQGLASALLWAAGVREATGAWATHNRMHLVRARDARGIVYNRFLLDHDPEAKPARTPGL